MIPAVTEGNKRIRGQPGLHSEFQIRLSFDRDRAQGEKILQTDCSRVGQGATELGMGIMDWKTDGDP